jgi:signal transduction histidine kinase/CheY-like chemotaxis protein
MGSPLRVLFVEDSDDEALLLLRALRQGGYEPVWARVDNAETLASALSRQRWDVILCDYVMPGFSAPAALRLVRERGLDVPIIIVSGQMGEEYAVEAMRAGAADYVSKNNLTRLLPAIERELQEVKVRWVRRQVEEEKVTLLEVARDVAGTLDLEEILDRVHRRTAGVLPCDGIATFYWDPVRGVYRGMRSLGIPERFRIALEGLAFAPEQRVVAWLRQGNVLVLNDIEAQDWLPREWGTRFEFTALIAAPLIVRRWMPGVLVAAREKRSGGFEAREVQLLEGIARQLALGVNAVELYRSQEQEARVSAALARVARELMSSLSQPDLAARLCEVTADVLRCDASHMLVLDAAQQTWSVLAGYGDHPEDWESLRVLKVPNAIMADLVDRLEEDDVVQVAFTERTDLMPNDIGLAYGFRGAMYAVLHRGRQRFGIHAAEYRGSREKFSPHDERILGGIASLASLALDHLRVLDELERANRLKSDFVATMSHELRTPLNVIMGYSDLLVEGEFGTLTPEQSDIVRRVDRSAGELLELINATLDVSRIDAGKLTLSSQDVRLQELLPELDVETRELQAKKPEVTFSWSASPQLQPLFTDRTKLKVVIKNLVANAVKFTDRGHVSICAMPSDGGVELTVADTGIGIAPQARAIIFEPFRQADSSTSRRYGGVGLGLYIARRLLDLLGGRIEVESEVDRGSTFRVWLPAGTAGGEKVPTS